MTTLRTLVYRERFDLDEFFEENQLWEDLYEDLYYELYNISRDEDTIDWRAYELFNEVYFKCHEILLDPHPEEHFIQKNLPIKDGYGCCSYIEFWVLVLILSYTILLFSEHRTEKKIQKFLQQTDKTIPSSHYLFSSVKRFIEQNTKSYSFRVNIKPTQPENLPLDTIDWENITDCFESDAINKVLNAWNGIEDKMKVLSYIKFQYESLYLPEMPPPNNPIAVVERRLQKKLSEFHDHSHTVKDNDASAIHCANVLLRENTILRDEVNKLSHHIEVLKEDNDKYNEQICSLSDKIKLLEKQLSSMPDEHTILRMFIDSIITYGEKYPSSSNDKAEVIRMLLLEKVVSDYIPKDILTEEIKARIEKLGRKEVPVSSVVNFNERVGTAIANIENCISHE